MEFKKYFPEIQARPSSLDTYVDCPMRSTLESNMDEFTSYIGKILHVSHQYPQWAEYLIGIFMEDYHDIIGERDNHLKGMLLSYVEKGKEFIEENKENNIYYEATFCKQIEGVWVSGTSDCIIDNKDWDYVEVIDYKTSKSPGTYKDSLEGVKKAQPFIYTWIACIMTGKSKGKFSYYVYGKGKKPKLYKHSREFTVEELELIVKKIITNYKTSYQLDIWEINPDSKSCGYCPLGWKGDRSCASLLLNKKQYND